jgi:hypothetical protein
LQVWGCQISVASVCSSFHQSFVISKGGDEVCKQVDQRRIYSKQDYPKDHYLPWMATNIRQVAKRFTAHFDGVQEDAEVGLVTPFVNSCQNGGCSVCCQNGGCSVWSVQIFGTLQNAFYFSFGSDVTI